MKNNYLKFTITLFFFLCIFGNTYLHAAWGEGNGIAADPFQIRTATDLNNLRDYLGVEHHDKHFILLNDIDLSALFGQEAGGWEPIGTYENAFYGKIHGNGFTIKGLYIKETTDNAALFGYLRDALIENLNVIGTVSGKSRVALLSAYAQNSNFSNCRVEGTITGNGVRAGGLIGYNNAYGESNVSKIENCYASVTVNSSGYFAGALIGDNQNENGGKISIKNCYSIGEITGYNHFKGGLIGRSYSSGVENDNISEHNVSAVSKVVGGSYVNRLVGFNKSELQNNAALSDMSITGIQITDAASGNNSKGLDISSSQLNSRATYESMLWGFENTWYMHPAIKLPQLYSFWKIGTKNSNRATSEMVVDTLSVVGPVELATYINSSADNTATITWSSADCDLIGLEQKSGNDIIPAFTTLKSDVVKTATFNIVSRLSDGKTKSFSYIIKVLPGAVSSIDNVTNSEVKIWFDRSAQILSISSESDFSEVAIFDFTGRAVLKNKINHSSTIISTSGWSKGIYILIIYTNKGKFTEKIIIS